MLANTFAVPGNHDYVAGSARDFLAYFGARTPRRTWFWRRSASGGVILGSTAIWPAQLARHQAWLERELRSIEGDGRCIVALGALLLISTGLHRGDGARMKPAWRALDAAGADLVLSGHEHFYESFEPRDGAGQPSSVGIREFVVGTGGGRLLDFSLASGHRGYARVHGVLELELGVDRYEFAFRTIDGDVRDAGSARCRRSQPGPPPG